VPPYCASDVVRGISWTWELKRFGRRGESERVDEGLAVRSTSLLLEGDSPLFNRPDREV